MQTASQAKKGAQTRRLSPLDISGAPGEIRTPDLRIRSPTLYPAELQELWFYFIEEYSQSARTTK